MTVTVLMILWASSNGFIVIGPVYNTFERCNESLTIVKNVSDGKVEGACVVGSVK